MTLRQKVERWISMCGSAMERSHNETYKWHKQIERDAYIRVLVELDQPELIMPLSEQHQAAEEMRVDNETEWAKGGPNA